jgi:TP901 family phage tail tape measure protein
VSLFRGVTVGTTLTLEKGKWSRDLKEARAELKAWSRSAEESGARVHKSWNRTASFFGTAFRRSMIAGGTAAALGIGMIVKAGTDFDKTMSTVKALTKTEADPLGFKALRDDAIKLGATTTFSAKQAAGGMVELGRSGFTTKQILQGMGGVLDAAAASGEDMASTAAIMTTTMYGFGLQAKNTTHIADVLAHAANDTQVSIADMGETFKYVSPIARVAGISLEQAAAMADIMAKAGIRASQAGTSMRMGLSQVALHGDLISDKAMGKIESISPALAKIWASAKPVPEKLKLMSTEFQRLDETGKLGAARVIFGANAMTGMLAVMDAGPAKVDKLTKSFHQVDGEAHKMGQTMRANVAGAWENFVGSLETVAITINDTFKGQVQKGLTSAAEGLGKLTLAMKGSGPTAKRVQTVIAGFGSMLAGIRDGLEEAGSAFVHSFQSASSFAGGAHDAAQGVHDFSAQIGDVAHTVLPVLGAVLGTTAGLLMGHKDLVLAIVAGYAAWKVAAEVGTVIDLVATKTRLAAVSYGQYTAAQIAAASAAQGVGVSTAMATAEMEAMTVAQKLSSAAQWGWNTAIAANPIGALATVVGIAVGGLMAWNAHTDNETSSADKAAAAERRRLDALKAIDEHNLASRSASFAYVDAIKKEREAVAAAEHAHRSYLKHQNPAHLKAWQTAQYEAARATAQREDAELRLRDAMKDREKDTTKLRKSIDESKAAYQTESAAVESTRRAQELYRQFLGTEPGFEKKRLARMATDALERAGIRGADLNDAKGTNAKLEAAMSDHVGKMTHANNDIANDQQRLKEAVGRAQGDIKLILKNTGSVKPEFREYTQGVIDNMHKAGLLTDAETAKVKARLEKGLDNAKPSMTNVADNFKTAIAKIFGGIKIPDITVPIKAIVNMVTGKGGPGGDGTIADMVAAQGGLGHVPKGVDPDVGRAVALGQQYGLSVGSMLRPGAITSTGNISDHSTGHAVDMDGSKSQMMAFARAADRLPGVKQVIYSPLGWARDGGPFTPIPASAGTVLKDHYSHVHVSMYQAGTMGVVPGMGDGDVVPALLEPGEGVINKRAVAAMGGPSAIRDINSAVPRFQRGTMGVVHVDGYTRADGTYVEGYDRQSPGTGNKKGKKGKSFAWHPPKIKQFHYTKKRRQQLDVSDREDTLDDAGERYDIQQDPKRQLNQAAGRLRRKIDAERTVEERLKTERDRIAQIKKQLHSGKLSAKTEAGLRKELETRRETVKDLTDQEQQLNADQADLADQIVDLQAQIAEQAHQDALNRPQSATQLKDAQLELAKAIAASTKTTEDDIKVVQDAIAQEAERQRLIQEALDNAATTDEEKAALISQMAASVNAVNSLNGELEDLTKVVTETVTNPDGTTSEVTVTNGTLAELTAQLAALAGSLDQAFRDENGNVFKRINIEKYEQTFTTPVAPSAAIDAFRFKLGLVG